MDLRGINNFFGDMDLFLMDMILKGKIPDSGKVLDAGCGEGRNAIYFIQQGYDFTGIDLDESKIRLAQYVLGQFENVKATFQVGDIRNIDAKDSFNLILSSRVLHFAINKQDFLDSWEQMKKALSPNGQIYLSMDSVIDNDLGIEKGDGQFEFPDGATRFSLTEELYSEISRGFVEVEPLRTLVQHETRAQSFVLLRKN